MRRTLGIITSTALALVLSRAVTPAAGLLGESARYDFASALMLTLFGETTDATASFSARNGDRISESPLRELALRVRSPETGAASVASTAFENPAQERFALTSLSGAGAADLERAVDAGLLPDDPHFSSLGGSPEVSDPRLGNDRASYTGSYEAVAPIPSISPAPGTLAFDSAPSSNDQQVQGSDASLRLDVPPAKRPLDFSVTGEYRQLAPNDAASFDPSSSASAWQLPGGNVPFAVPNFAGSDHLTLRAGVAVPVFHSLTLNFNYDAQRSYGGDAVAGLSNVDAANNVYAGKLTYAIPSLSSTLSISAYQDRSGQSVLPNNTYTQNGGDVNFTVKF